MDKIKAFFEAMTFWNWLALIGFIFFPLSALNAFLGLRSRHSDWRATRAQKQFDMRLKELETTFFKIERLKQNQFDFLTEVLNGGILAAMLLVMALMVFVFATITPFGRVVLSFLATTLMLMSLYILSRVANLIILMQGPLGFAVRILNLINRATAKGLTSNTVNSLSEAILTSKLFCNFEVDYLKGHILRNFPPVLAVALIKE